MINPTLLSHCSDCYCSVAAVENCCEYSAEASLAVVVDYSLDLSVYIALKEICADICVTLPKP